MTAIGHIAAGLAIAHAAQSPAAAVAMGILSHAAMDYALPEYRGWPPLRHWPWWLWQAAGSVALLCRGWPWAAWGVLGAMLPDLVDGVYSLIRPQAWQSGELLCPWHRARKQQDMLWPLTFAVEAIFIALALRGR